MPKFVCGCVAHSALNTLVILLCVSLVPITRSVASAQTSPASQESRFSRGAEAEIQFQQGKLQYQSNQLPQAEQSFKQVIAADSADAEAYYFLGLSQLDQNKLSDAIQSFDQSLRLEPTRLEVHAARARANILGQHYPAAEEDLTALAPNPQWDSLVHYFRGQIAYAKGNLETAANEFAAAKAAGGTEAEPASFYQGLTYIRMRQLVQARASFQQTTIDPERDPTVAAAARQLDAVLAQQQAATGPTKPWEAELTISYVYDSNVIQLGSDAQLPTGISHKADSRTVLQPRGSYSLFHNDKVEIGVEGSGYFAYQFDLNDFDTYSYQIGPFISYKFSPNLYGRLSYAFNYIELGHDPYLNRNIVTPSLTYVEPKLGYTQAYYQFEARQFSDTFAHQDDPNSFDNRDALDRDGQDHTFGLVQGINLPEIFRGAGNANLQLDYRLIDQETHGSDYDGLFNQVGATIYTPLPFWGLRMDAGVTWEADAYRHGNSLDTDFDRHDKRFDQQWNLSAGITRQLFQGCSLRVDYTYTTNDSNVRFGGTQVFDYDRNQVGVRLIYSF